MEYGRLGKSEQGSSKTEPLPNEQHFDTSKKSPTLKLLLVFSVVFLVVSAVSVAVIVVLRARASGGSAPKPSVAISRTCSRTRYPNLCVNSLVDFPGALSATERDLVPISVNVTLRRFGHALSLSTEINNLDMDAHLRSAYEDCLELLEDAVEHLFRSLTSISPDSESSGSTQDVVTWLSAALTNQDTCTDGLDEASNSLAIYATESGGDELDGIPIQNRRRLMESDVNSPEHSQDSYPKWLGRRERELMDMPAAEIQADIVVSKDGGNGTYKTIAEAIKKAPENSDRRTIIYVMAGKYEEDNLKVGRKKKNLMFIGAGKGKTVITGGKSVADKLTTFHTASFGKLLFSRSCGSSLLLVVAIESYEDKIVISQKLFGRNYISLVNSIPTLRLGLQSKSQD
ncbi:pectin methylesterase PCR fragment F [Actinidia rufa]|uniref:Pectin methylesterase PCR F n=1 Tax=Actinidia rufa TaxID=165716 RepID=A0A7J0DE22_9ERIC|nr:pectin methylesterase PCR fragment F [Actinidia rufa]